MGRLDECDPTRLESVQTSDEAPAADLDLRRENARLGQEITRLRGEPISPDGDWTCYSLRPAQVAATKKRFVVSLLA